MTDIPSPYRDNLPGFKNDATGCSRDAAAKIAPRATSIRVRCLSVIESAGAGGIKAHDVANALGLNVYQVRSRIAELKKAGLVIESGEREAGEMGRDTNLWIGIQYAPKPPAVQGDLWGEAA